jgi:hypothetical protein
VRAVVQTLRQGAPQSIIPVEDAPARLHGRVEQAVAGRAVPQRKEPRAEPHRDLERPVERRRLVLQLRLRVPVQQLLVQLLEHRLRQIFDLCESDNNFLEGRG